MKPIFSGHGHWPLIPSPASIAGEVGVRADTGGTYAETTPPWRRPLCRSLPPMSAAARPIPRHDGCLAISKAACRSQLCIRSPRYLCPSLIPAPMHAAIPKRSRCCKRANRPERRRSSHPRPPCCPMVISPDGGSWGDSVATGAAQNRRPVGRADLDARPAGVVAARRAA